jgi:hypothetical protein
VPRHGNINIPRSRNHKGRKGEISNLASAIQNLFARPDHLPSDSVFDGRHRSLREANIFLLYRERAAQQLLAPRTEQAAADAVPAIDLGYLSRGLLVASAMKAAAQAADRGRNDDVVAGGAENLWRLISAARPELSVERAKVTHNAHTSVN